ncbi:MAG: aldo/keto reductase [Fusobacteriaceae bacterium]|jgi:diketogulonate reductase-like aldo/keto reductase|nr:aldo/keto reductase [Fusobacteriaceae bacterium]
MTKRDFTLANGMTFPALGEGTWYLGEKRSAYAAEKESLIQGARHGLTLIDTAEMYGSGKAEILVGDVLKAFSREELTIVSKVYPHNAGIPKIYKSCEASLKRLGTDYLDVYLLHWRGSIPLSETVEGMEKLVKEGKIKCWGVSNFDISDMEELWEVPGGNRCQVNQVLYHAGSRGIEYDLLPWMRARHVALMAYCPLAQGGTLRRGLFQNTVLREMAQHKNCTVSQILLAFAIRDGHTVAIPRTSSAAHAIENAKAAEIFLTEEEIAAIDRVFPAPKHKTGLDIM